MRDDLHDALESGDAPRLEVLIDAGDLSADELNEALTRSVAAGNAELVRLFLKAGANPNVSSSDGVVGPAILSAVEGADPEIIELIFSQGGDPNLDLGGGSTPIFVLIEAFDLILPKPGINAMRRLIKWGARVDVRDPQELTPVQFAERLELTELIPCREEPPATSGKTNI